MIGGLGVERESRDEGDGVRESAEGVLLADRVPLARPAVQRGESARDFFF